MNQDNDSAVSLFIPRPEHLEEINQRVDKGSELLREKEQNLSRGASMLLERPQVSDASRSSAGKPFSGSGNVFPLVPGGPTCGSLHRISAVPVEAIVLERSPCAPWEHLSRCSQSLELTFHESKTLAAHNSPCHQPIHPPPPPP